MTDVATAPALAAVYPTARVRGRLVTRTDARTLGWATLDAARAAELGRDAVGWFVGGHPGVARAAQQLGRLDANPDGGAWVVVPSSGELTQTLRHFWPHPEHAAWGGLAWRSRKVWVVPPERLRDFRAEAKRLPAGVAGVIVLDPSCYLFNARGGPDGWGNRYTNDRPQHVVDFRHDVAVGDWQPPLILLTERAAGAVNTEGVARAFCLNALQFVAGDSFACWDEPILDD